MATPIEFVCMIKASFNTITILSYTCIYLVVRLTMNKCTCIGYIANVFDQ